MKIVKINSFILAKKNEMSLNWDSKKHWNTIYETKNADQVSWTQKIPKTSLHFIRSFQLHKTAEIIDIGGGESTLVDYLLEDGFTNITVLDISANAIEKAKKRLGERANSVTWIVSDILQFKPKKKYTVWHDRATFHFLTTPNKINAYIDTLTKWVTGYCTIATFSKNGPKKCSGLTIKSYNEQELTTLLENKFLKIACLKEDHTTPFNTTQNFLYCSFKKINL